MTEGKSTFALFIGNRGFFPAQLLRTAREEMTEALEGLGHRVLAMDPGATRHGAVETPEEGRLYAEWLEQRGGEVDGVVLCLPNFGDENGAVAALKNADVPILVQAYPDELDRMAPEERRDAFCGKFSIMDLFCQHEIPFSALKPHTVHPRSDRFAEQVDYFDRLCRVVGAMRDMVVGAVGARTTAFKTVRIDELALQRHGITTETLDLSDVFARMRAIEADDPALGERKDALRAYTNWDDVPEGAFDRLARLGVVLDEVREEFRMDALAVRCWVEMQEHLGISPCVLLSQMNDRRVATACEVDVGNAVAMHGLSRASGAAAMCLDWNNNYGDDPDRCILFHCGSAPQSLMAGEGRVADHAILANAVGEGQSWGCNVGRLAPGPFTFASMTTEAGEVKFYVGEGELTEDPIPPEFFGCGGVARIDGLQDVLQVVGYGGFRHHVSATPGHLGAPVAEALRRYLGCEVTVV